MKLFKKIFYFLLIPIVILELILTDDLIGSTCFILSLSLFLVVLLTMKTRVSDIYIVAFLTKLFVFAWVIKLINLESITYRLLAKDTVPYIVLCAVFFILLIHFILDAFKNMKGILNIDFSAYNLRLLSKVYVVLGLTFELLHITFRPVILDGNDTGGFGGFGGLTSIGYLGIILYLYNMKLKGHKYLQIDSFLVSVLLAYLAVSLLANTKYQLFVAFIAVALSLFSFKLKVKMKQVLLSVLVGFALIYVVTPLIHKSRTLEFRLASFSEKVVLLSNAISTLQHTSNVDEDEMDRGYLPVSGKLIDRLDILSETDKVIAGIDAFGFVGSYPLTDGFEKALPGFLVPNRSQAATNDKIMWDIREKTYPIISRLTIGIISSVYAVSGVSSFIIFFPLIFISFVFVLVALFGGKIENNVLAVFFMTKYLLFVTEKPFSDWVTVLIRDLPVTLILIWLVLFMYKIKYKRIVLRE